MRMGLLGGYMITWRGSKSLGAGSTLRMDDTEIRQEWLG
jgi:hypothetical protein